jgi:hypothetical protein
LTPPDAAAIQSEGKVIETRTEPLSAVAHVAGGAPVRISRVGSVPVVVSIASSCALRDDTEY